MRPPASPASILAIVLAALLLAVLPACAPRTGAEREPLPELHWEPDSDVHLSHGILLLDQSLRDNDVSGVRTAIRILADASPSSRPFVEAAAWLLLNRSPALTREVLQPAVRRFPDDINPFLLMAESWLEDKKPDQAVHSIRAFSAAHPDSIQARQELAVILTKAEQYKEAAEVFDTLPAKAFSPFIRYCRAKALAGMQRQDEAIRELRRAAEDMPEFVEAWNDLAKIHEQRGEYRQAADVYEQILEQDPSNHGVWLRLIAAYLDAGDRRAALDVAENGADSDDLAFTAMGLFLERKIYPEAETLIDHVRSRPGVPPGMLEDIRFCQAIAAYEGRRDIPLALSRLDRISPASRFYERSLRLRAQLLFENKERAKALDVLHEAQKRFPGEVAVFLMEAHLLNLEKRLAEALAVLDDLLARQPDNPDVIYSRGMTLDLIGRKTEAMAVMERLVADNPD
jgi:predicted Zn-dependent protease